MGVEAPITGDRVVTIHEAKTHLSRLVAAAEGGAEIVIARGKTPVAKIVALAPPTRAPRKLGWLAHEKPAGSGGILDAGFWEPLSEAEVGLGPDALLDGAGK